MKHDPPPPAEDVASPIGSEDDSTQLLGRLALNIRLLRGQRGMTRKNLAEQSGVSLPHLARLEGSQGNVSVVVLDKVARALNQPITRLFADHEETGGNLDVIIEYLKRQSPERLTQIREQFFTEAQAANASQHGRIALIGLRGAGKSTVGKALAERLGRPFIELNEHIQKEAGLSVQEIITLYGQTGFRNLERRCLEQIVMNYPAVVLATGGGIVVEPKTYELLLNSFLTVWLRADPEVHFQRVMAQNDSRIASPALYREAMENIRQTLEAREPMGRMAQISLDTTPLTVDAVVDQLIAQMPAA